MLASPDESCEGLSHFLWFLPQTTNCLGFGPASPAPHIFLRHALVVHVSDMELKRRILSGAIPIVFALVRP